MLGAFRVFYIQAIEFGLSVIFLLYLTFVQQYSTDCILTICSPPLSSTGKLLVREEARSGSLNNLHVFPTGGYIKPSRGPGRSESFGGSGRSSRSSSIASDRSGSLNSIPGSVTSVESR